MPVAFLIVLYSRKVMGKVYERTMQYRISCQDGIQEGLETLRDLRSYNMTDTYMSGLETKIKAVEKNAIQCSICMLCADDLKAWDRNRCSSRKCFVTERTDYGPYVLYVFTGSDTHV